MRDESSDLPPRVRAKIKWRKCLLNKQVKRLIQILDNLKEQVYIYQKQIRR